jgi:hypothetical protein
MRAPGAPTQYGRITKRPGSKRELVCIETAGLHRAFNHCRRGLRLAPPKPACHAVMPLWRRRATAGPVPPPELARHTQPIGVRVAGLRGRALARRACPPSRAAALYGRPLARPCVRCTARRPGRCASP